MDERSPRRDFSRWLHTNQGVGAGITVLLVILLVYLLASDWVYTELRDGMRLGFCPVAAVVLMIVCSLGLLVDRHRKEAPEEQAQANWQSWFYPLVILLVLFVYFHVTRRVGFVFTTPVLLVPVIYWLGARPWKAALAAALIITVSVYVIFRILNTNIPQGPLPI